MTGILLYYQDGEYVRERLPSREEAMRLAYLGLKQDLLKPLRIETESYAKSARKRRVYWDLVQDGPLVEYLSEVAGVGGRKTVPDWWEE